MTLLFEGRLGDGTEIQRNSPVQIATGYGPLTATTTTVTVTTTTTVGSTSSTTSTTTTTSASTTSTTQGTATTTTGASTTTTTSTTTLAGAYGTVNLAKDKTLTALTNTQQGTPQNAVDGEVSTVWYSYQGSPSSNAFTVDLGASYSIGRMVVYPAQVHTFTLSTSADGSTWTERYKSPWTEAGVVAPIGVAADGAYSARYVWVETHTWNTPTEIQPGIAEIEVLEWVAASAAAQLNFISGWNLVGNSNNATLDVATAFGDGSKVTTVWKWLASKANWAFYTPTLSDGGAAYAASKGYDFMTSVGGGEGFWVNAKAAFTASLPAGTAISSASFQSMGSGWNLIAAGDNKTPSAFNQTLSQTPPAAGEIPINLTTLWAWDATLANWYFYAPSLEKSGGLTSYIASKSYLDFGTKVLDPVTGFWVNKP